jgi:hypothetical protein
MNDTASDQRATAGASAPSEPADRPGWQQRAQHLLAVGRIAFGLGLMVAPSVAAAPFLGADASRPTVRFMSRLFGVRDVALGIVQLRAQRDGRPDAQARALWLGAACDAWDAASALRRREIPALGRVLVGATGMTAAGIGAAAALSTDVR